MDKSLDKSMSMRGLLEEGKGYVHASLVEETLESEANSSLAHSAYVRTTKSPPRSPGADARRRRACSYSAIEAQELRQELDNLSPLHGGLEDTEDDSELRSEEDTSLHPDESAVISGSKKFQHLVGLVIMLNTVLIAVEAEYIRHEELKGMFFNIELAFTLVYVGEVSIRVFELGVSRFFGGPDWAWNNFDFLITSSGVLDTALGAMGKGGVGASAGRLFRVLRIMRLFRALKFLKNMDYVIATAAKATLKLALLVILVVFVSAIIFTNMLWDADDDSVNLNFGDLGASMWTMFTLMTLENWTSIVGPVLRVRPGMRIPVVLFIFFASIALMSLVPAIFIELNMSEREKKEQDDALRAKHRVMKLRKQMLGMFFKEADADHNGRANFSDMLNALKRGKSICQAWSPEGEVSPIQEDDLRQIKLGVFDLWEKKSEELGTDDVDFTAQEFIKVIMKSFDDVDAKTLWCGVTSIREKLHELSDIVLNELPMLRKAAVESLAAQQDESIDFLRAEIAELSEAVRRLQVEPEKGSAGILPDLSGSAEAEAKKESEENVALQQEVKVAQATMRAAQAAAVAATTRLTNLQRALKCSAEDGQTGTPLSVSTPPDAAVHDLGLVSDTWNQSWSDECSTTAPSYRKGLGSNTSLPLMNSSPACWAPSEPLVGGVLDLLDGKGGAAFGAKVPAGLGSSARQTMPASAGGDWAAGSPHYGAAGKAMLAEPMVDLLGAPLPSPSSGAVHLLDRQPSSSEPLASIFLEGVKCYGYTPHHAGHGQAGGSPAPLRQSRGSLDSSSLPADPGSPPKVQPTLSSSDEDERYFDSLEAAA